MESISKYSYEFDERQSNLKDPLLYSNSINTEDMIESEMNSSRKKSCTFVHTDTTSNLNNSSEVNISEFDSTSILIPSSIDSELQSAAQAFVEELIFRAQKEVNSKNLSKHKVRLRICRINMLYHNTQKCRCCYRNTRNNFIIFLKIQNVCYHQSSFQKASLNYPSKGLKDYPLKGECVRLENPTTSTSEDSGFLNIIAMLSILFSCYSIIQIYYIINLFN